ncbi:MAG: c-type cytochrome [Chloroflexota bacterium]|nr:c-type cytochrome [Chloroflexota bacterium]
MIVSAHARLRLAALLASLILVTTACTGLGGEPVIVATLPPPTPTLAERGHPAVAPNIAAGAQLYALNCTDCHGITGAGDGQLVQSGQVMNAKNFRAPDARQQRPLDWFNTITNGNLERLMPPWRDALTEQQRWEVTYYTYTLHYTPEQIVRGREVYAATCAECHGASGVGDGERAGEFGGFTPDLTNQETMATLSDQVLFNIISEGQGDMHALADDLSEDDRWAAVSYTRTLTLASTNAIASVAQAATPVATSAPQAVTTPSGAVVNGVVSGRVVNGTAGGGAIANLPVTLVYYDADLRETALQATTDASGSFSFANVPISDTFQYAAIAEYGERSYFAPPVLGDPSAGRVDFTVTVYERTEDAAVITISAMVSQVTAVGASLEVTQLFTISNSSDRAYSTNQTTPDGRAVSLAFQLPPGAVLLGFPSGEGRFVLSTDQTTVLDTAPTLPGDQNLVAIAYVIPYEGSAIIEQVFNYALNGQVRILVQPDSVQLSGTPLTALGPQQIGQTQWQGYGAQVALAAGSPLRYELAGASLEVATGERTGVVTSNNLLPLLVIGIVIEIIIVALLYVWWRQRRNKRAAQAAKPASDTTLMDGLIRQIAELDARHERGEIDDATYQRQRGILKQRLSELMEK